MECSICNVEKQDSMLFNAITKEGVVKVCGKCATKENIPIIHQMTPDQMRRAQMGPTIYERLSSMAGLNPQEHKERIKEAENYEKTRQDRELRRAIGKKDLSFPNLKIIQPELKQELIRNYHWEILKARRARKLTQRQLAEEIGESENAIKLAEKGTLPANYIPFIKKLQVCLNITLFTNEVEEKKQLGFDKFNTKQLTISDLQEIKKESSNSFFPYWKRKLGFLQKKREDKKAIEEVEKSLNEEEASEKEEENSKLE